MPQEPENDTILRAGFVGLILRAKTLGLSREDFLEQARGAWDAADRFGGLWDAVKQQAGTNVPK